MYVIVVRMSVPVHYNSCYVYFRLSVEVLKCIWRYGTFV